jgi:hypothetical protein
MVVNDHCAACSNSAKLLGLCLGLSQALLSKVRLLHTKIRRRRPGGGSLRQGSR